MVGWAILSLGAAQLVVSIAILRRVPVKSPPYSITVSMPPMEAFDAYVDATAHPCDPERGA